MAKSDDLFTLLRRHGLRKSTARAVAKAEGGGKKSAAAAHDVLADLGKASDAIRDRITNADARKRAGKKAAATRKRKAAQRSAAGKQAARTRRARAKSR